MNLTRNNNPIVTHGRIGLIPITVIAATVAISSSDVAQAGVDPAILEVMTNKRVAIEKTSGELVAGTLLGSARKKLTLALDDQTIVAIPHKNVRNLRVAPDSPNREQIEPGETESPPWAPTLTDHIGERVRVRTFDCDKQDGYLLGLVGEKISLKNSIGRRIEISRAEVDSIHLREMKNVTMSTRKDGALILLIGGNLLSAAMLFGAALASEDCLAWGECAAFAGLAGGGIAIGSISTGAGLHLYLNSSTPRLRTRDPALYRSTAVGLTARGTF